MATTPAYYEQAALYRLYWPYSQRERSETNEDDEEDKEDRLPDRPLPVADDGFLEDREECPRPCDSAL